MATSRKKIALHLTDIPDHLLAEIFLRLPDPADLARASAACVTFRRLATDRYFLRRFRCLHAPHLLGFLDRDGFHPALPPYPSAPAARALALAADFSFSFLPSHCRWTVQDCRDGRVLLHREQPSVFQELAACDPLHRQCVLLPPVPEDLAASVEHPVYRPRRMPFLVPLSEAEAEAEETSFRVIWMADCKTRLVALVFSSSTGQWQAAASKDWSDLVLDKHDSTIMSQVSFCLSGRHYAYGCFYWYWAVAKREKMLVFDTNTMEFSIANLPPGQWRMRGIAIVEAGEGRLGMFGFHGRTGSLLSYIIARNRGKSPSQWQMERTLSLESGHTYHIRDATKSYLLLTRKQRFSPLVGYFSMDVKTLQIQSVCENKCTFLHERHIYTNFPPSLLSSWTI